MIIWLSILFLILLVFWGRKMKEGMTIPDASNLIDELGTYYAKTEKNKKENIDNSINVDQTYTQIQNLSIVDKPYIDILNNTAIEQNSQINLINQLITKSVNPGTKPTNCVTTNCGFITINQFQKILKTYNNETMQNSEKVTEITAIATGDPRFINLYNNTYEKDTQKLCYVQHVITHILLNNNNPPPANCDKVT